MIEDNLNAKSPAFIQHQKDLKAWLDKTMTYQVLYSYSDSVIKICTVMKEVRAETLEQAVKYARRAEEPKKITLHSVSEGAVAVR